MNRMQRIGLATLALAAIGAGGAGGAAGQAADEIRQFHTTVERVERAAETQRLGLRYRALRGEAAKLDADPKGNLLTGQRVPAERLERGVAEVRKRIAAAKRERARERRVERSYALAGGVSQATLDSIAACESGGDPAAVNPAGYYGKYQFDMGTWASVGGSGNPAEASEAEQDHRASLLYSRAGSSPWPVCGS